MPPPHCRSPDATHNTQHRTLDSKKQKTHARNTWGNTQGTWRASSTLSLRSPRAHTSAPTDPVRTRAWLDGVRTRLPCQARTHAITPCARPYRVSRPCRRRGPTPCRHAHPPDTPTPCKPAHHTRPPVQKANVATLHSYHVTLPPPYTNQPPLLPPLLLLQTQPTGTHQAPRAALGFRV